MVMISAGQTRLRNRKMHMSIVNTRRYLGIWVLRLRLLRCEFPHVLVCLQQLCTDCWVSVSFIISLVLVYKEDREKKVTGQVSYA